MLRWLGYIPLYAVLLFLLVLGNCVCGEKITEPERNNINDPGADNYVPPQVNIATSLRDGDTLTVDRIIFHFEGSLSVQVFSYYLKGKETGWLPWINVDTVAYDSLDEGGYVFYVRGRSAQGTESAVDSINFVVNAIHGPALVMSPRNITAGLHETLSVNIMAEEVANVMQADLIINFNTIYLEVVSMRQGPFLASNGGEVQFLSQTVDSTITINTGVALANPAGVTGTGVLATIRFRAKAQGTGLIRLSDASKLLTPNGIYNEINITNKKFNSCFNIQY